MRIAATRGAVARSRALAGRATLGRYGTGLSINGLGWRRRRNLAAALVRPLVGAGVANTTRAVTVARAREAACGINLGAVLRPPATADVAGGALGGVGPAHVGTRGAARTEPRPSTDEG